MRFVQLLSLMVYMAMLAACGGGGTDGETAENPYAGTYSYTAPDLSASAKVVIGTDVSGGETHHLTLERAGQATIYSDYTIPINATPTSWSQLERDTGLSVKYRLIGDSDKSRLYLDVWVYPDTTSTFSCTVRRQLVK